MGRRGRPGPLSTWSTAQATLAQPSVEQQPVFVVGDAQQIEVVVERGGLIAGAHEWWKLPLQGLEPNV